VLVDFGFPSTVNDSGHIEDGFRNVVDGEENQSDVRAATNVTSHDEN